MGGWKKKRDIMQRYNITAHMYDMRYADEQIGKIKAALKYVKIEKHDAVLDVGCGTGILFDRVSENTESVVGLDISRESLVQAKERAGRFENVQLILADADNMPFKSRAFNIVFVVTILQNMPEPEGTLNEIKRVAATDSQIVVTGLKKIFTKQTFERLLDSAGL
jgi:ubiquinone/menaquinone biosynthesis C-methylase UbiE